MRKIFTVVVIICALLLLVSCSSGAKTPATNTPATNTPATNTPATSTPTTNTPSINAPVIVPTDDHEIYKMAAGGAVDLVGIRKMPMASRADIYKALPSEPKQNITIGFAISGVGNDYFGGLVTFSVEAAAAYGYTLHAVAADFDLEKQSQQIDNFITMKVDAIIVDAVEPAAAAEDIQKAVNAGIPVVCYGPSSIENVPVVTYVNDALYVQGWTVGRMTADAVGKDTSLKIGVFCGFAGLNTAESQVCGQIGGLIYERYLQKGVPFADERDAMVVGTKLFRQLRDSGYASDTTADIELLTYLQHGFTTDGGLTRGETALVSFPQMNLMISDAGGAALGLIQAAQEANKKIGVDFWVASSGDTTTAVLKAVKDGLLLTSGHLTPAEAAGNVVNLVHLIFSGGFDANNLPLTTFQPILIISKANVDQFYDASLTWPVIPLIQEFKSIDQLNAESSLY